MHKKSLDGKDGNIEKHKHFVSKLFKQLKFQENEIPFRLKLFTNRKCNAVYVKANICSLFVRKKNSLINIKLIHKRFHMVETYMWAIIFLLSYAQW